MSALLSGVRPSLLVPLWSVGGVAIGMDKLALTRPVPEGEAVRLILGWRDGAVLAAARPPVASLRPSPAAHATAPAREHSAWLAYRWFRRQWPG